MNLFALISWALYTPLLKIPLLVSDAILIHIAMTPPNPPPGPEEKKKFTGRDILINARDLHLYAITVFKWCMCGLATTEAAMVVVQEITAPLQSQPGLARVPSTVKDLPLRITPAFVVGGMLAVAGGLSRLWSYRTLGRLFAWELSVQDGHRLITSGPYAIVRHPSYTSWIVLHIGNLVMFSSAGSYCVEAGIWRSVWGRSFAVLIIGYFIPLTAAVLARLPAEDEVLREQFGSEWEAWAKKTPYRLVPYLY